jgi:hypothetical protein
MYTLLLILHIYVIFALSAKKTKYEHTANKLIPTWVIAGKIIGYLLLWMWVMIVVFAIVIYCP